MRVAKCFGNACLVLVVSNLTLLSCGFSSAKSINHTLVKKAPISKRNNAPVFHVVVALCDNKYQGIIPVPARIGNGDDLVDNLYWGADYGVKTYFCQLKGWSLVSSTKNINPFILERLIFQARVGGAVIVADAYRGREIRRAAQDFLTYSAGGNPSTARLLGKDLQVGGGADMLVYVGHNGLMDFKLPNITPHQDSRTRKVAVLVARANCISRR
jgi:hypothetical protein